MTEPFVIPEHLSIPDLYWLHAQYEHLCNHAPSDAVYDAAYAGYIQLYDDLRQRPAQNAQEMLCKLLAMIQLESADVSESLSHAMQEAHGFLPMKGGYDA